MKITYRERWHVVAGAALVGLDQAVLASTGIVPDLEMPVWLRGYALAYFTAGFAISLAKPGAYLLAGAGVFVAALLVAVAVPSSWGGTWWPLPPQLFGGATMAGEVFGAALGGIVRWLIKSAV